MDDVVDVFWSQSDDAQGCAAHCVTSAEISAEIWPESYQASHTKLPPVHIVYS